MEKRVPASMRTRQSLSDADRGASGVAGRAGRTGKLATRLIVEEALEAECRDALGRDYYERGAEEGRGLKTAEGLIDFAAPQVAGREEPFRSEIRSHLKGRTEALEGLAVELLARGLSVRDIEDAFRDENGRLLLSRTAVSELGEQLWADYQDFASRDLSEYEIVYLFVDGIAERIRPGQRREPVMAAWGYTATGSRVLLSPDGRLQGGRRDGHGLLPGHARPRARRPAARRLRRRAGRHQGDRDLLPALGPPALPGAPHAQPRRQGPEDQWPELKARVQAAYQAPSRAIARDLAAGVVADYARDLPSAVACFEDDFEACIAHLRMPVTHRRAIRTTNLLERLFVEERRRLKIIPNAFGERPVLKLMFGAMIRAAERWRAIKFTDFERRQIAAVREDLDKEYQAQIIAPTHSSAPQNPSRLSSSPRTSTTGRWRPR